MANWWQVQRLKRGVEGWNRWREQHPNVKPNLHHTNLSMAYLRGADLTNADLSDASLRGADLSMAYLREADLVGANLSAANLNKAKLSNANLFGATLVRADLSDASLRGADLSDADLSDASLFGANLSRANLSRANLSRANLSRAYLSDADLSYADLSYADLMGLDFRKVKGLALINHRGPSAIHLSSLQLPQDGSALHFLRGVGLTNEQIDAWRTTAMLPIQYHSVFISYSSKDEILASRLHADLQAHGVRCWFAPEDMKIGNKIRDRIDQAIHLQDRSLLVLSEHSIASAWVEEEVEAVLEKERRQQREILFPIRLDEAVMQTSKAWAATLRRTRHIGDFTAWADPTCYQTAFDRLLRDLQR